MFTIREEQYETLQESSFMDYLLKTFRKRWPEKCRALGGEKLISRIESGLERAESYGIKKGNNKVRFINLGFLLDSERFDTDESLPWARTILGWENGSENLKVSALEKRAELEIEKRLEEKIRSGSF